MGRPAAGVKGIRLKKGDDSDRDGHNKKLKA